MSFATRTIALAAGVLATLAAACPVHAQTPPPPDTLDWHRYYPLAVGNAWEYSDAENPFALFRHVIESDTTIQGRLYYRRVTYSQEVPIFGDTVFVNHDYVRYDTAGVVVAAASPAADTVAADPCADNYFARDLRLGFGARVKCPMPPPDSVIVEGAYDLVWTAPGGELVEVAAIKYFFVDGIIYTEFVADVGPVGGGNLWGPRLHYARVGGVEYGTPRIPVAAESVAPAVASLEVTVLRNPVRQHAAFGFRSTRPQRAYVEVFDVVGRRVWKAPVQLSATWSRVDVPVSEFGAGTYFVRVSAEGDKVSRPFTVMH